MASAPTIDPFKTRDKARTQILFSLLGVWATSLILQIIFNAKCWGSPEETSDSLLGIFSMLALFDIIAWGFSIYHVFERMDELFVDNVAATCYLSAIGSLCGLVYIAFVKKGRMSFRGWVGNLGWPFVAIITASALFGVISTDWDDLALRKREREGTAKDEGKKKDKENNKKKEEGKNLEEDKVEEEVDLEKGELLMNAKVGTEAEMGKGETLIDAKLVEKQILLTAKAWSRSEEMNVRIYL